MSESARTLAYAGVAAASVVIAGIYGWATQPARVAGFETVGSEFYPEFKNPSDADSLRVVAFNEDTATIRQFSVARQKSGQWVIPSHYDYPADAREKLNKTANSIIGIKRGAQKGSRENEHKELGVLDPLSEGGDLEGRGKRITLKNGDDILVDYIIGEKAKEEGNLYYVRKPKENEVYLAEMDVELSTSFGDWIEADLLKVNRNDLVEVTVNKYSIDEEQQRFKDQEVSVLSRDKSFDPWKLEGLNEEVEELKTKEVDDLVNALDGLKIVGVRPKPKGLTADLTVDPKYARSQGDVNALVADLQMKGFYILPGADKKAKLFANEGNVMAATEDGLVYTLNFGEVFSGSIEEIEIGKKSDEDDDKKDEPSMSNANSRYLFVSVAFDEKYLGEKPTKPAEPQKPEGLVEEPKETQDAAPDEEKDGEAPDCGGFVQEEESAKEADQEAEVQKKPESKDSAPAEPTEEEKQKKLQADWAKAQIDYKNELKKYETQLKDFNEKVTESKKKVDDLNYRLGAWYYVISGESFEKLRLARADLVKTKEKPEGADKEAAGAAEPKVDAAPEEKKEAPAGEEAKKDPQPKDNAATEKKAADEKSSDEKPADAKPADSSKEATGGEPKGEQKSAPEGNEAKPDKTEKPEEQVKGEQKKSSDKK